jgi:ABC-type enterochelin transport system ATPase subunit
MKKLITFFKLLKTIKENEKEKNMLMEYVAFCISKQNEYIKINDPKQIELYNLAIEKTFARMDFLDRATHELKRDARLVR